jgi:membrane-bound ClpP family serine protease
LTNESDFNDYFEIFGDNPFQWHNFIGFLTLIGCVFTFGKRNTGLALMLTGGVFLFLEYIVGLSLIGSTLGILFLIIGGLTQYRNLRSEVRY